MLKNNDTYKSGGVNKLYPEYLKQKKRGHNRPLYQLEKIAILISSRKE